MLTIISVYTIKTNVAMCENSNALGLFSFQHRSVEGLSPIEVF
jgi:hypothetical protein